MYPLALLLVLAAWRHDLAVRPYALALALIGTPISAWHYLVQRFPQLESGSCDPDNPCSLVWVWRFGYVSVPLMAGTAFVLLALLIWVADAPEHDHGGRDGAATDPTAPSRDRARHEPATPGGRSRSASTTTGSTHGHPG